MSTLKLRRQVSPLDVFCTLHVKAGNKVNTDSGLVGLAYCPLVQTYDAEKEKYEVSRTEYPTVIVPNIRLVSTIDNVEFDNSSNKLVDIVWYVQRNDWSVGQNIATVDEWKDLYTITSTGIEKGAITISKDVPSDTTWDLWMVAKFDDNRTGSTIIVDVISEREKLVTNVNAENAYTLITDASDGEVYESLLDSRIEYDYKLAKGIIPDTTVFVDDGKTYLKKIDMILKKGSKTLVAGTDYTIRVESVLNSIYTEITELDDDIHSISGATIVFDLRWKSNSTYRISALVNNNIIAQTYFGYQHSNTIPRIVLSGGGTFSDKAVLQAFEAVCSYKDRVLEYPEAYVDLDWYSKRQNGDSVQRGGGKRMELDMTSSDVIQTADNNIEIGCVTTKRKELMYLVDTDEDVFTDENDSLLTIN